jgi:hypothetical protein
MIQCIVMINFRLITVICLWCCCNDALLPWHILTIKILPVQDLLKPAIDTLIENFCPNRGDIKFDISYVCCLY